MKKPATLVTWLGGIAIATLAVIACTREDYEPDPKPQTLVPCHPNAAEDDPLACSPDAAVDAGVDGPVDAATDAPGDAAPDGETDAMPDA